MSTENRTTLSQTVVHQIRHFIAATILFNQKVADEVGLHLTDMQCINVLELLGPTTPGELARRTGLTTGGVTVMLDRLEKGGYVRREPNPSDRRSLLVRVHPKKLEKLNRFYGEINQRFAAILEETPEPVLKTVVEFFAKVNEVRSEPPLKKTSRNAATRSGK